MRCSSILCVRAIARSEVLHCCDAVALPGGLMQWQRYFYATTSSSRTRTPRSRNPRKRRPRFVGEACLSFAERLKPGARSWKNASRALTHHFLFFSWGASEASSRQQQKRIHTIRRSSNTLRRSELRGIQLFFSFQRGLQLLHCCCCSQKYSYFMAENRSIINRGNDGLMSSASSF